jgi:hypothetical protein
MNKNNCLSTSKGGGNEHEVTDNASNEKLMAGCGSNRMMCWSHSNGSNDGKLGKYPKPHYRVIVDLMKSPH